MLSYKKIKNVNGIIHVGAHLGEEKQEYGSTPVIWIEGNPRVVGKLKNNVGDDIVIPRALSNISKTTTFNIATDSGSSSLNEFETHTIRYPGIDVKHKIIVNTYPFSVIVEEFNIDVLKYNFLVLSAGGSELDILIGFDRYFDFIDYIFTKYYDENIFKKCPSLKMLKNYLISHGYILSEKSMTDKGWGKALFKRALLKC